MNNVHSIAIAYHPYFSRVAALMTTICAVSVLLYGIFLLEAVSNAGGRQSAERQVRAIGQEVSGLEARYLTSTQSLTPERAQAMGFVAPVHVATVIASQKNALTFSR